MTDPTNVGPARAGVCGQEKGEGGQSKVHACKSRGGREGVKKTAGMTPTQLQ